MASAIEVGVEAIQEHQIQEVTLEGQEIYVQQLSMSENLTKLAHKIDFSKDESEGKGKPTSETDNLEEDNEEKNITPFQPSLWPWDSVRNRLKASYTEVSVLLDVINIAREKRYMVLDPVQQANPETKQALVLAGKKKALAAASTILMSGADRLKKSQDISSKKTTDFHQELLRLRQHWRLKKVGNIILGDLSYKSAGSRFWQSGTFEVTKTEAELSDLTESPTPQTSTPPKSSLQVTIPSELKGCSVIQVTIKKLLPDREATNLMSAELDGGEAIAGTVPDDTHYQRRLEAAQNVVFCKEVFAQLAREAVRIDTKIPHMVVANQIFLHLFPSVQLSVTLCNSNDKIRRHSTNKSENSHVLEHTLHVLLREAHFKNYYHSMPHPVTALMGMSKKRRMCGPFALSRSEMMDLTKSESLLEQVINQAKHIVLRRVATTVLDELARLIQDPLIAAHWSNTGSATQSLIKVNITSNGYDMIRTTFALEIGISDMLATCKDGKVLHLSHEEQELRDLVLCQIVTHHIYSVFSLAKMMGWNVLSVNPHLGVGDMEAVGNAQAIMLSSPTGHRVLSIRCGPMSAKPQVMVQRSPDQNVIKEHLKTGVITDQKWSLLGGKFREVHLDQLEGKNFVNKIELLMACLTAENL